MMIDKDKLLYLLLRKMNGKGRNALKSMISGDFLVSSPDMSVTPVKDSMLDLFISTTIQLVVLPTHLLNQDDVFTKNGFDVKAYKVDQLVNDLEKLSAIAAFPSSSVLSTDVFTTTVDADVAVLSPVAYNGFVDDMNRASQDGVFSGYVGFEPLEQKTLMSELPVAKLNDGQLHIVNSSATISKPLVVLMNVTLPLDGSVSPIASQMSQKEAIQYVYHN